jgi:hypothetical protein
MVVIQSLLNVSELSLENVTGRLRVAEDELEAPPPMINNAGKLYLSEEAWEKWKAHDSKKSSGGGSGGRGGGRRGGRLNRGHGNWWIL